MPATDRCLLFAVAFSEVAAETVERKLVVFTASGRR